MSTDTLEITAPSLATSAACRGRQRAETEASSQRWRTAYHLAMRAGDLLFDLRRYAGAAATYKTAATLVAETAFRFLQGRPGAQFGEIDDAIRKLQSSGIIDRKMLRIIQGALDVDPWTPKGAQNARDLAETLWDEFNECGLPGAKPPRNLPEAKQTYGVANHFRKFDCTPRLPPWKAAAK